MTDKQCQILGVCTATAIAVTSLMVRVKVPKPQCNPDAHTTCAWILVADEGFPGEACVGLGC